MYFREIISKGFEGLSNYLDLSVLILQDYKIQINIRIHLHFSLHCEFFFKFNNKKENER